MQGVRSSGGSRSYNCHPSVLEAGGSQLSMGMPWTHRRWRRVPDKMGGVCFSHDPMPKRSATPRIALIDHNREAKRALRGGLQWSTQPCIEFGIRPRVPSEALAGQSRDCPTAISHPCTCHVIIRQPHQPHERHVRAFFVLLPCAALLTSSASWAAALCSSM
jgi:hypothetical protein